MADDVVDVARNNCASLHVRLITAVLVGVIAAIVLHWGVAVLWVAAQMCLTLRQYRLDRQLADGRCDPAALGVRAEAAGLAFAVEIVWAVGPLIAWVMLDGAYQMIAFVAITCMLLGTVYQYRAGGLLAIYALAPHFFALIFVALDLLHAPGGFVFAFGCGIVIYYVVEVARGLSTDNRRVRAAEAQKNGLIESLKARTDELRTQEARWHSAIDAVGAGGWEFDLRTQTLWRSQKVLAWLGPPPKDNVAALLSVIPEPERFDFERCVLRALKTGQPFSLRHRLDCLDGRQIWVDSALVVEKSPDGAFLRVVGFMTDVTAQKTAELDLVAARAVAERNRERWELAAATAGAAAYEFDVLTRCFLAPNPRLEALLGTPLAVLNATGVGVTPMIPEPWQSEFREKTMATAFHGAAFHMEHPIRRHDDGRTIWVRSHMWTETDAQGRPARCLGFLSDITAQKEIEQTLRTAQREADEANRAKSEFLATMSHEIRTPMNAILGLAELLAREELSAQAHARVETLRQSGEVLMAILNDVLDISKIEAGRMDIEAIPMSLQVMLEKSQRLWAPRAEAKGLAFRIETDGEIPEAILADSARLQQILFNLLSNAVKFTSAGEIVVRLSCTHTHDRLGFDLSVSDSGIGISAEAQARLFQPFAQADTSTSRQYGGAGLGLSIARRLAEAMGGKLELVSKSGVGSTFTLRMTAEIPQHASPSLPRARVTAPRGLSILLAEDNPVNQQIVQAFLAPFGHRIVLAANGAQALSEAQLQAFDIILMDVQMPHLDGLEATRAIRMGDGPNTHAPIIGLTADAFQEQRQRGFEAGMTDYLTKPIEPSRLIAALAHAMDPGADPKQACA